MLQRIHITALTTLRGIIRDRTLHAVVGGALVIIFLVPAFSMFSMRQVQELAITLTLSAISSFLFVLSMIIGASSVWRDIEKRYCASVLTTPLGRTEYIVGKFIGIVSFIVLSAGLLGLVSAGIVKLAALQYPSDLPILWKNYVCAVSSCCLKYILLAGFAVLFGTCSTSFFLPIFGTIAIYIAGSGSQEVFEYVSGEFGKSISPVSVAVVKGAYYLLPNFSAFNFNVQAVYALPIRLNSLFFLACYFILYIAIVLSVTLWIFRRRELQ